jgi:putative intracellular protease/amidase
MKIIVPIPNHDFDPTEVCIPWKTFRAAGHDVDFATPDGRRGYADPMMISGEGLDPWGWVPGLRKLRLIGLLLRAGRRARDAYQELEHDARFLAPKRYQDLNVADYDAMLLPGGHAKRMKTYLEDRTLQRFVADFFGSQDAAGRAKPVAAVCHGVLLAARSVSAKTGRSVLHGRKTTALTWRQERMGWLLSKYVVRFWDPNYYRTYVEKAGEAPGFWSVEMEVRRALASAADFVDVPGDAPDHFLKTGGLAHDGPDDSRPAWVVRDRDYVSARWPGDAHTLARIFLDVLDARRAPSGVVPRAVSRETAPGDAGLKTPTASF